MNSAKKQFQDEYVYSPCNPNTKLIMKRMLLRGSSIKDIATVLMVSIGSVLRLIVKWGQSIQKNIYSMRIVQKTKRYSLLLWEAEVKHGLRIC